MKSWIRSYGAKSSANGRRSIPNSRTCLAKFKIAVSGSDAGPRGDAGARHRLASRRDANGRVGFRVLAGGGLAARRCSASVMREFLPWQDLLEIPRRDFARLQPLRPPRQQVQGAHQDPGQGAHARSFSRAGRSGMGASARWASDADSRGSAAHRAPLHAARLCEAATRCHPLMCWRSLVTRRSPVGSRRNVHPHKIPGYAAVTLSLKKTGVPPGDATADQMDAVADLADAYSFGELRVSHEQNLILADVRQADLYELWQKAQSAGTRDAEHRTAHQHHRVPGRRFLLARQCEVDPGRRGDPAPLRRSRLRARHRRARSEYLRLHELMRPSSHRPYRHTRRRQAGRRVLSDLDRRRAGQRRCRSAKCSGLRSRRRKCPT